MSGLGFVALALFVCAWTVHVLRTLKRRESVTSAALRRIDAGLEEHRAVVQGLERTLDRWKSALEEALDQGKRGSPEGGSSPQGLRRISGYPPAARSEQADESGEEAFPSPHQAGEVLDFRTQSTYSLFQELSLALLRTGGYSFTDYLSKEIPSGLTNSALELASRDALLRLHLPSNEAVRSLDLTSQGTESVRLFMLSHDDQAISEVVTGLFAESAWADALYLIYRRSARELSIESYYQTLISESWHQTHALPRPSHREFLFSYLLLDRLLRQPEARPGRSELAERALRIRAQKQRRSRRQHPFPTKGIYAGRIAMSAEPEIA